MGCFRERKDRARVRLPFQILLIKNEVFQVKKTELVQCLLALLATFVPGTQIPGLRQNFFQVGGNHQSGAFAIDVGNSSVKWRGGEAVSRLRSAREGLQLIEPGTGSQYILMYPDEYFLQPASHMPARSLALSK